MTYGLAVPNVRNVEGNDKRGYAGLRGLAGLLGLAGLDGRRRAPLLPSSPPPTREHIARSSKQYDWPANTSRCAWQSGRRLGTPTLGVGSRLSSGFTALGAPDNAALPTPPRVSLPVRGLGACWRRSPRHCRSVQQSPRAGAPTASGESRKSA